MEDRGVCGTCKWFVKERLLCSFVDRNADPGDASCCFYGRAPQAEATDNAGK